MNAFLVATAVLLFRGFTLMLPLLPGPWLAHREMNAKA